MLSLALHLWVGGLCLTLAAWLCMWTEPLWRARLSERSLAVVQLCVMLSMGAGPIIIVLGFFLGILGMQALVVHPQ